MKKLLVFNWKMNPRKAAEAHQLARSSDFAGVVVAPPFVFLEEVEVLLKKALLGAQDLFWQREGAFTGEVSADELKNFGVEYVIIGHSERRQVMGETDAIIARKIRAALTAGLRAILCVGETKAERSAQQKEEVLDRQLTIGISQIKNIPPSVRRRLLIAYEPVWAIGTGTPETPEDAATTSRWIKKLVKQHIGFAPPVLYGGSVNSQNIRNFVQLKDIDGALIGGASLKKLEVKKIVELTKIK